MAFPARTGMNGLRHGECRFPSTGDAFGLAQTATSRSSQARRALNSGRQTGTRQAIAFRHVKHRRKALLDVLPIAVYVRS